MFLTEAKLAKIESKKILKVNHPTWSCKSSVINSTQRICFSYESKLFSWQKEAVLSVDNHSLLWVDLVVPEVSEQLARDIANGESVNVTEA